MTDQKDLGAFLEKHSGESHLGVIQDYPDPDALGSAFLHKIISNEYDIQFEVVFDGKVSHQQNKALVNLLGLELIRFDRSLDVDKYDGAVFIDNQGTTAPAITDTIEEKGLPVLFVIDHHEPQDRLSPAYKDVRRVGATATIYIDYLQQGVIDFTPDKRDHVLAATAMMHGVLTDTNNLIRAGEEDFKAALFLSKIYDRDMLDQIMSQARSKRTMEVINIALQNRTAVENITVAGVGYLRSEDRDAIPQAADFLLSEENIHTAIVYGIVEEKEEEEILVGSVRSNKLALNIDQFIKDTFGKDDQGIFYGGGKLSAGGFEIPLGFLSGEYNEEYQDQKWDVYDQQMKHKILAKLGLEISPEDET